MIISNIRRINTDLILIGSPIRKKSIRAKYK